jgi:hypothetical protein
LPAAQPRRACHGHQNRAGRQQAAAIAGAEKVDELSIRDGSWVIREVEKT